LDLLVDTIKTFANALNLHKRTDGFTVENSRNTYQQYPRVVPLQRQANIVFEMSPPVLSDLHQEAFIRRSEDKLVKERVEIVRICKTLVSQQHFS
jgi:hypothetical protein